MDAGTAFEILSIDIADIDIGKNIGAALQIDQANADKNIAPVSYTHLDVYKRQVVAGCRIEGYRAVAVFKLLGVQQVLSELLTQVQMCIRDRMYCVFSIPISFI